MDWSNLDSQFLSAVFGYFSFREQKILSLVCRNWYEEIGFLCRDKLKLNFEHFLLDRRSLESNTKSLANSKRFYVSLKIENNCFFEDTAAVFKAISLRRNLKCKRVIKSLELKDFNIVQIEDVFSWMGESLERLCVSNIAGKESFKSHRKVPSKIEESYFKIFSNLKSLSLKKITEEFQRFFKFFENVTELTLNCVNFEHLKESLRCCSRVKELCLGDIYCETVKKTDFTFLLKLENLEKIEIKSSYTDDFYKGFVEELCNPEVKHPFCLKVFYLYDFKISEANLRSLVTKFPEIEDILIESLSQETASSILKKAIWDLKYLKVLRGEILKSFKLEFSLVEKPLFFLTTVEVFRSDYQVVELLEYFPNLETLYISNIRNGDLSVFRSIYSFSSLKTLVLSDIHVSAPSWRGRHYMKLTPFRISSETIEELRIKNCPKDLARNVEFNLPKLKKITSSKTSGYFLHSLVLNSKNIEIMYLDMGLYNLSDIRDKLPKLHTLFFKEASLCVENIGNFVSSLRSIDIVRVTCTKSKPIKEKTEFESSLVNLCDHLKKESTGHEWKYTLHNNFKEIQIQVCWYKETSQTSKLQSFPYCFSLPHSLVNGEGQSCAPRTPNYDPPANYHSCSPVYAPTSPSFHPATTYYPVSPEYSPCSPIYNPNYYFAKCPVSPCHPSTSTVDQDSQPTTSAQALLASGSNNCCAERTSPQYSSTSPMDNADEPPTKSTENDNQTNDFLLDSQQSTSTQTLAITLPSSSDNVQETGLNN